VAEVPTAPKYETGCYIRDPGGYLIEVRQTTDPAGDWSPPQCPSSTALGLFNAMLARYPERRLGATVLWAGTNSLYANTGDPLQDALAGWVTP
jgi:hypothetical protein